MRQTELDIEKSEGPVFTVIAMSVLFQWGAFPVCSCPKVTDLTKVAPKNASLSCYEKVNSWIDFSSSGVGKDGSLGVGLDGEVGWDEE